MSFSRVNLQRVARERVEPLMRLVEQRVVVVPADRVLALLADHVRRHVGLGAVADDVAEAVSARNVPRGDVLEDRRERLDVAVHVGNERESLGQISSGVSRAIVFNAGRA